MPTGLYFVLKYFSFTFTIHLTYSITYLQQHNLFGAFQDVITEFHCVCIMFQEKSTIHWENIPYFMLFLLYIFLLFKFYPTNKTNK
jgi:hypothetical protein